MCFASRVNCSFFFKIGACRHGERCSRLHNKPTFSQTILLQNLYINPQNSAQVGDPTFGILVTFIVIIHTSLCYCLSCNICEICCIYLMTIKTFLFFICIQVFLMKKLVVFYVIGVISTRKVGVSTLCQ